MRAVIVAIGSELLGTDRLDTNSLLLTRTFRRYGVTLRRKTVVGDDLEVIADEVALAMAGCELVVVTGGLGPTADDLTREAVARAFDLELVRSPDLVEDLRAKFRRFGLRMPEVNLKQADVLAGAEVLPNRGGTAAGQRLERQGRTLFLLPGVPRELEEMIATALEPWLRQRCGGAAIESGVLKTACLPESTVEERIEPYYREFGRGELSVRARPGEVTVVVTVRGEPEERRRRLRARLDRLAALLGPAVFADAESATLEEVVGGLLRRARRTLATAESCTGGLVAERVTRAPGSSEYFLGGVVAYADRIKQERLGVSAALLARHGAVSEEVVRAMADGARARFGSDFAIAVSGIAGPGGGSPDKPVGTVHLAVAGPGRDDCHHRRLLLPGERERVRWLASQWALDRLRRTLAAEASG